MRIELLHSGSQELQEPSAQEAKQDNHETGNSKYKILLYKGFLKILYFFDASYVTSVTRAWSDDSVVLIWKTQNQFLGPTQWRKIIGNASSREYDIYYILLYINSKESTHITNVKNHWERCVYSQVLEIKRNLLDLECKALDSPLLAAVVTVPMYSQT